MALRSAIINVMAGAAQRAGRGLIRDFGEVEQLQVSRKGPADFVSAADRRAEAKLRQELTKARPNYGLLMEESGAIEGSDISNRWIVDPLDGTTNFLHGLPYFCVSIALERDRQIYAGVIYDPLRDELFWAERGIGAFVNSKRLRVSGRERLSDSVLATGFPFKGKEDHAAHVTDFEAFMARSVGIRRFGAAALDLAYVAAGRFDGFWERNLSIWDIAAGTAIVREAGGIVTDLGGAEDPIESGNVLAAGAPVHERMLAVLKEVDSARAAKA